MKTMALMRVTLLWVSCLPQRHRMPNKKPSAQVWDTSPHTCGWRFLEIPKTVQTIIIVALGCLTKLHSKASLLKTIAEGTTYTGYRIRRNHKWVLTRKHPTSNTVTGCYADCQGRKASTVLPSCESYEL